MDYRTYQSPQSCQNCYSKTCRTKILTLDERAGTLATHSVRSWESRVLRVREGCHHQTMGRVYGVRVEAPRSFLSSYIARPLQWYRLCQWTCVFSSPTGTFAGVSQNFLLGGCMNLYRHWRIVARTKVGIGSHNDNWTTSLFLAIN